MAFNYFANDAIKQIEKDNIPEKFASYYEGASESRKAEIENLRPDLIAIIKGEDIQSVNESDIDLIEEASEETEVEAEDIESESNDKADDLSDEDAEANAIIDAWEDISISSWLKGNVEATVLVCKFIPDNTKNCGIHRIPLKEVQLSYKFNQGRARYGVRGLYCPECMDFFLEEKKAWVIEQLDSRDIPIWMQTVDQTLQDWRENGLPLELDDDTAIYIPEEWKEKGMVCPIHQEVSLVEDFYVKRYKDRKVDFQACYCNECNKIIMRNSKAQKLEEDCGEIGIPPIDFHKLRPEPKKIKNKVEIKIKPKYLVQNGSLSEYDFEEDVDWAELTEDDTMIVSYSRSCSEADHETEDILALLTVDEKKGGRSKYLVLMGYCSECEKYYIDQDDYNLIYDKGRPMVMVQDDTNSDYYVTSGSVFDSEKKHLDDLEGKLDSKISEIKANPNFVSQYAISDVGYDDGGLAFRKAMAEPLRKEMEQIASYMPNPYAHRADFAFEDDTKVYYLGPDDIVLDGKTIVISYNSDFGQELVNYQTIEMKIDGVKHKAKRRRDFDITKGTLFGYTEQSDEDVIFRSGITDPYLVKVLNARKKQHQLLDIVATAQMNQRDIINLPLGENIIVQGCAGSGKTMVLLQRMSSLKYKNKDFDFSDAIILTPNDNFNTHISGLASSLQLGYIERRSVEGYYLSLLEKYDESFKLKNKIIDEMNVPQEYVDYIYSDEFWELFVTVYNQQMESIREEYSKVSAISVKVDRSETIPIGKADSELVKPLIIELSDIHKLIVAREEAVQKAEKDLTAVIDRISFLEEKMPEYEQNLEDRVNEETATIFEKLKENINKHNEANEKYDAKIGELRQKYEETDRAILVVRKAQKLKAIEESIAKVQEHMQLHLDEIGRVEGLMTRDTSSMSLDEKMSFFRELTEIDPTILSNIATIERNMKNLDGYKAEIETELPAKKIEMEAAVESCKEQLYPEEISREVKILRDRIKERSAKEMFLEMYQIAIARADAILKAKYGKTYIEKIKGTHRFDLFVQVRFAQLYFNKKVGTNTFICVDEGQDLTVSEYRLIREINPGNPIFNIYGDVNQLLKYNRGISNWSAISESVENATMHILNENYRNTNQITQYCNDSFDMKVSLTGADGHKVKEIIRSRLEGALSELRVSEERVAIILPRKVNKSSYIDKDQLPSAIRDILGVEMGNGKIAVVYVDEVKGVEFDRVFVVPNTMTKNEKYIAYTRALSDLTIVLDDSIDVQEETNDDLNKSDDAPMKDSEDVPAPVAVSKNVKVGKVRKRRKKKSELFDATITEEKSEPIITLTDADEPSEASDQEVSESKELENEINAFLKSVDEIFLQDVTASEQELLDNNTESTIPDIQEEMITEPDDVPEIKVTDESVLDVEPEVKKHKYIVSQNNLCAFASNKMKCIHQSCKRFEKKCQATGCEYFEPYSLEVFQQAEAEYSQWKKDMIEKERRLNEFKLKTVAAFDGVRYVECSSVNRGTEPEPDSETISRIRRHYKKTGDFEWPITVTIKGDKFYVLENYEQLAAAHKMGVEWIPATYTDIDA